MMLELNFGMHSLSKSMEHLVDAKCLVLHTGKYEFSKWRELYVPAAAQCVQGTARHLISVTCGIWDGEEANETTELMMTHCKKSIGPHAKKLRVWNLPCGC